MGKDRKEIPFILKFGIGRLRKFNRYLSFSLMSISSSWDSSLRGST